MKRLLFNFVITSFVIFGLTACKSRTQADQVLRTMCIAGIQHVLPDNVSYDKANEVLFSDIDNVKRGREVMIDAQILEFGFTENEDFVCRFIENYAFFGLSYIPDITYIEGYGVELGYDENDTFIGRQTDYVRLLTATKSAKK